MSPLPWLHRVALNLCYSRLARRRPQSEPIDESTAHYLPDAGVAPAERAEQTELRQIIRDGVAGLPEKHRSVVILYYLHGLSLQETAALLDVRLGTVKSRLHYALRSLRAASRAIGGSGRTGSRPRPCQRSLSRDRRRPEPGTPAWRLRPASPGVAGSPRGSHRTSAHRRRPCPSRRVRRLPDRGCRCGAPGHRPASDDGGGNGRMSAAHCVATPAGPDRAWPRRPKPGRMASPVIGLALAAGMSIAMLIPLGLPGSDTQPLREAGNTRAGATAPGQRDAGEPTGASGRIVTLGMEPGSVDDYSLARADALRQRGLRIRSPIRPRSQLSASPQ